MLVIFSGLLSLSSGLSLVAASSCSRWETSDFEKHYPLPLLRLPELMHIEKYVQERVRQFPQGNKTHPEMHCVCTCFIHFHCNSLIHNVSVHQSWVYLQFPKMTKSGSEGQRFNPTIQPITLKGSWIIYWIPNSLHYKEPFSIYFTCKSLILGLRAIWFQSALTGNHHLKVPDRHRPFKDIHRVSGDLQRKIDSSNN